MMKTLKNKYLYVLILFTTPISFVSNIKAQDVQTINIEKKLGGSFPATIATDFISAINYIPLETGADFLIAQNPDIIIGRQLVIVKTMYDCFAFDKASGKFIRTIGTRGKGPNEFRNTSGFVNPEKEEIFFLGWRSNLIGYSFDGKYQRTIVIPGYNNSISNPSMPLHYTYLGNNIVAYYSNIIGSEKKLLMIFNRDGEIIHIHNNPNVSSPKPFALTTKESKFYHYNNQLFFKENYCDTVYRVTEKKLFPRMVLFTGKYRKPYESKWGASNLKSNSQFLTPGHLIESKNYFCFQFFFKEKALLGIYDKRLEQLQLFDVTEGLLNNIDGGTITNISGYYKEKDDEYMVGWIHAYQLKEHVASEEFKNSTPKFPEKKKELEALANSLSENDNPVLMLIKLKE